MNSVSSKRLFASGVCATTLLANFLLLVLVLNELKKIFFLMTVVKSNKSIALQCMYTTRGVVLEDVKLTNPMLSYLIIIIKKRLQWFYIRLICG